MFLRDGIGWFIVGLDCCLPLLALLNAALVAVGITVLEGGLSEDLFFFLFPLLDFDGFLGSVDMLSKNLRLRITQQNKQEAGTVNPINACS